MTEYELTCRKIVTVDAENEEQAREKAAETMHDTTVKPGDMSIEGQR